MTSLHEIDASRHMRRVEKYIGQNCEFQPTGWVTIDNIKYPIGYKVMTGDLQSLGLRNNPNILTFVPENWTILPEEQVLPGDSDYGGIWAARKLSGARNLTKYMKETYKINTRCFQVGMKDPLFANDYRVKSVGVFLIAEIQLI